MYVTNKKTFILSNNIMSLKAKSLAELPHSPHAQDSRSSDAQKEGSEACTVCGVPQITSSSVTYSMSNIIYREVLG